MTPDPRHARSRSASGPVVSSRGMRSAPASLRRDALPAVRAAAGARVWALLGCARAPARRQSRPSAARSIRAALREGRPPTPTLCSATTPKRAFLSRAFERMVRENPDEIKELAQALERPCRAASRHGHRDRARRAERCCSVYEEGAWRVDGSAIDLYSQATPEAAVLRVRARLREQALRRAAALRARRASAKGSTPRELKQGLGRRAARRARAADAGAQGGAAHGPLRGARRSRHDGLRRRRHGRARARARRLEGRGSAV